MGTNIVMEDQKETLEPTASSLEKQEGNIEEITSSEAASSVTQTRKISLPEATSLGF